LGVEKPPSAGLPRLFDTVVAGSVLVLLSPLLLLLAVLVKATSPGPALFRQRRVGRGGNPFTLFKFRSMTVASSGPAVTASGDRRVTPVGRLLRLLKLDELPQFWNVLVGDMSLVGPRPEVPEYVEMSDRDWKKILSVRPGLTDPVTVRLRNEEQLLAEAAETGLGTHDFYKAYLLPWKKRGYLAFIEKRTPLKDFKTILQTAASVLWPPAPPTLDEVMSERSEGPEAQS
jgi:lipopolysaccharide/colanic/teichoic acid biosynthesis glycosyltransferase